MLFCDGYKGKSSAERKQHVEANGLCLNCLGKYKLSECFSNRTCSYCNARHHMTIHDASSAVATTSHFAKRPLENPTMVLLATARVRVKDRHGIEHKTRALIDQGSESSLVSESLVQRLRLSRSSTKSRYTE